MTKYCHEFLQQELRVKRKLKYQAISIDTGLSPTHVRNTIYGARPVTRYVAMCFEKAYGFDAEKLMKMPQLYRKRTKV